MMEILSLSFFTLVQTFHEMRYNKTMEVKKGTKFQHLEPDGSYTFCKLVEPLADAATNAKVRWIEPRWSLSENILLNRKGTISTVNARDLALLHPVL